jgi:hypothetical protein
LTPPSCPGLWEALFLPVFIGRTAAAHTGASRCYWHSLLNRSRVCMFLRNSRLEPYTAGQLSRPAAISWGGLVLDLVFRSSHSLHNFLTPQRTAFLRPPDGHLEIERPSTSLQSTSTSLLASRPILSLQASALLTAVPAHEHHHSRLHPFSEAGSYVTAEEFWLQCAPGIHDFETLDDSPFGFSNLETGLSQSDLDFLNLEFPITETLGPVLQPDDSFPLFPQDPALEQIVEDLLEIAGDAPSQRDGTSLISAVSSFTPPATPTSSPSPSIHCSWPTCKKVFKNRSDYK